MRFRDGKTERKKANARGRHAGNTQMITQMIAALGGSGSGGDGERNEFMNYCFFSSTNESMANEMLDTNPA